MSNAGSRDVMEWTQLPSKTARAFYDQDEFGWLLQQADLLREGRMGEIDRASLVEFLTDMARTHQHAFRSAMTVLLHHMLKVLVQPERMTRSWLLSIRVQQREARLLVKDNPECANPCRNFTLTLMPTPAGTPPLRPASPSAGFRRTALGHWRRPWPSCRRTRRHVVAR